MRNGNGSPLSLATTTRWPPYKISGMPFASICFDPSNCPSRSPAIEDFRWEERYVLGGFSRAESERLKKECLSYQDKYELLAIELGVSSGWMLSYDHDIGAHVKWKSDEKEFWLGLSELKGEEKKSRNAQLLHDFSVFFVKSR